MMSFFFMFVIVLSLMCLVLLVSAERLDLGRIVSVDVLHHHSAVATLFCNKAGDEPHRPTPIDFNAGTNAFLSQHHVDSDRTRIVETAQTISPPSPYCLEILQGNVLCQPSKLLLFWCHPVAQVRPSLVGIEKGKSSVLDTSLSIEPLLKGEFANFVQ